MTDSDTGRSVPQSARSSPRTSRSAVVSATSPCRAVPGGDPGSSSCRASRRAAGRPPTTRWRGKAGEKRTRRTSSARSGTPLGTSASGRSSYASDIGAPRPAASAATPPMTRTTRIAKNHIIAQSPRLTRLHHHPDRLVHVVGELQHLEVGLADLAVGKGDVAQPGQQPGPVLSADQHDREPGHLLGLDQGQRLEQLVERPEATGQHREPLGVLDEHRLAREEVAEVDADVGPAVEPGLPRQLDAEPHAQAAGLAGPPVGGLHRTRPAARDHREPGPGQLAAQLLGQGVRRVLGRRARGAEHGDGRSQLGQGAEALDELRLDPQDAPRIGVHPVRRSARVEQPLVGGAAVDLVAALDDRALLLRPHHYASHSFSCCSQRSMCSTGTCSSCLCASIGSPGPKLTAGIPRLLNRATSVQPNLGLTSRPTASTKALAAGRSRPGRAPGALSTTVTSYPSKKSRTNCCASASPRSGANRWFTSTTHSSGSTLPATPPRMETALSPSWYSRPSMSGRRGW